MNKEVKSIVIEISFIVLLLVICVPIFVSASSNYNNSLEKISNDDIIITNMEHNSFGLYVLSDEEVLNKSNDNLFSIVNKKDKEYDYDLYLRVRKNSTIDISKVKIKFNNEILTLNDIYDREDDNYYYYLLKSDKINDEVDFSYLVYLDDNSTDYGNNSLTYSFLVV